MGRLAVDGEGVGLGPTLPKWTAHPCILMFYYAVKYIGYERKLKGYLTHISHFAVNCLNLSFTFSKVACLLLFNQVEIFF